MRRLLWSALLSASLCLTFAGTSWADTFTYTFDAPNFTLGQTTPMLNVPPNIGAGTFTTSFTSLSNAYTIAAAQQNGLISGPALIEPTPSATALTLNFSAPVSQISFVFAINVAPTGPAGILKVITPSGSLAVSSSVVGGGAGFPGGTVIFLVFPTFSTATIQGFQSDGITPTQIEIDNLALDAEITPEPCSMMLLGIGLSMVAGLKYRKRI